MLQATAAVRESARYDYESSYTLQHGLTGSLVPHKLAKVQSATLNEWWRVSLRYARSPGCFRKDLIQQREKVRRYTSRMGHPTRELREQ